MKEIVKQGIINEMANALNFQQLQLLEKVLHQNFRDVEMSYRTEKQQPMIEKSNSILDLFISAKKVEGCSEKSLKYYQFTIEAMLNTLDKKITAISTNDLRSYLADYQARKNTSKVTIDNIRRIFSSFFSWLEDEDYIIKSPVRRIHKVKSAKTVKATLSDEEIEVLRDNCKEIRDLALVEILSSTGMRVGELVKINRDDVDFHERSCIVNQFISLEHLSKSTDIVY
ncbi:MAG: phage integrase N-terminal SAM-like domain-containing protein [Bacteroidetes bacterium]|nr:phage integrase N-terminal SAM-like domain-containing protein [Bacteroidota bacterium]